MEDWSGAQSSQLFRKSLEMGGLTTKETRKHEMGKESSQRGHLQEREKFCNCKAEAGRKGRFRSCGTFETR